VHGPAFCNGRDREKQLNFKDLALEYLATNQAVVSLNPVLAQIKKAGSITSAYLAGTGRYLPVNAKKLTQLRMA
jgi:hypothetical protein